MQAILNWLFTEEEALNPRALVAAGLIACIISLLRPFFGLTLQLIGLPLMMLCLGLVCYGALRALLPLMDPRDADSDSFVVWGSAFLVILVGLQAFGVWFLPGLALGTVLIWLRVPQLLEVIPGLDDRGNDMRHE